MIDRKQERITRFQRKRKKKVVLPKPKKPMKDLTKYVEDFRYEDYE